jgi:putative transposase
MPRKKHTPEQIIAKLRETEVALSTGSTVVEAVHLIGVTV